jgi:hypothetical protein
VRSGLKTPHPRHAATAAVSLGAVVCMGSWLSSGAPSSKLDPITFEDIAGRAGVDFVLLNSATPAKHQIATMAASSPYSTINSPMSRRGLASRCTSAKGWR